MSGRRQIAGGVAVIVVTAVASSIVQASRSNQAARAASPAPVQIHSAHGASFLPALQGKRPLFILAIGSDARPNETPTSTRGDSLHLIGVNLQRHRASILGFPRDSYVNIPGHGTDKINSALFFGGPALVVQTIESLTGIRIDFWVLTGFKGFRAFWNDVGPIEVDVPLPMSDSSSGAFFSPGKQSLKGSEALAFARDRHDVPGGDIGRSENQGRLLVAAMAALGKRAKVNPAELLLWMASGWRNVSTDIPAGELLDLALTAIQISPKKITNQVVPSSTGTAGAASVVFISSSASSIYADMRADGIVGH